MWLEKYHDDVFPSGFVTVDGKRHPVPPFYLKRLAEKEKKHLSRKAQAKVNKSDQTYARRNVREQVMTDRISTLKRNLK